MRTLILVLAACAAEPLGVDRDGAGAGRDAGTPSVAELPEANRRHRVARPLDDGRVIT